MIVIPSRIREANPATATLVATSVPQQPCLLTTEGGQPDLNRFLMGFTLSWSYLGTGLSICNTRKCPFALLTLVGNRESQVGTLTGIE
jgi:hypothetical protein